MKVEIILPTISASKLKVYKTCQKQFYYKYILPYGERPPNDHNVAGLLGQSLHKAIEMYYKEGSNPTIVFQEYMMNTIEEWENSGNKINAKDYFTKAMKVGKDILKTFDWKLYNPALLEYKFELPFPNAEDPICMINGLIDMVDIQDKKVRIIDFKSASVLPAQDEIDNDAQFILYYWAMDKLKGSLPDEVIWHHLRTGKQVIVDVWTNYEDKLSQLTYDIESLLAANMFPRINLSDTCKKRCSFYNLCFGDKTSIVDIIEEDVED